MKIIQRLHNLINWSKLNAPDGYDFYTTEEGKIMIGNLLIKEKELGYKFEGKPQATIIKRKMSDEEVVDELLKE